MAKGKVSREGGESFTLPDTQSNLDPDTAIVGDTGAGDGVEVDLNEDEKDWDSPPAAARRQPEQQDSREDRGGEDFAGEDARLAYSGDPREQDEDANQRPGRRSRRNARRRESQNQAQAEITALKEQLQQLGGVVRHLATGQSGLAVNSLEGQIVQLESALRMADEEMASAVKNSDGDTYSKAQTIRDNIVGRLWGMKNRHAQLMDTTMREREGGQVRPEPVQERRPAPQIDPEIVAAVEDRFDRFCDRFPWFDPQSADADCNIVRSIDQELSARGLQRHTPNFWEQMERRMAQYGLKPDRDGGGDDDQQDEPQRRPQRQASANNGRRRPPTGSGRSTQNGRTTTNRDLPEIQVGLLRDEGLLEEKLTEEDVAKRDRILARWRKGTEGLRRQGAR